MTLAVIQPAVATGQSSDGTEELMDWAQGPVRWLLLPSDWREIRRVETPAEAANFVERFWQLRDPEPATIDNEFRAQFLARVEAADLLYAERNERGSLTARGRALILLGPPPHMQIATEDSLAWKPGRRGSRSTMREVQVEIWRYAPETLPAKLVRVRRAADLDTAIEIKFSLGRRGAQLVEGENALITAARLALVQD